MRTIDLPAWRRLLESLERGEWPDEKTIRAARRAFDRERSILTRRAKQHEKNLLAWRFRV